MKPRYLFAMSLLLFTHLAQANSDFLGDLFSGSENGWVSDQWQKLEVRVDLPVSANLGIVEGKVKYQYNTQPAFIKGLHQRTDAWSAQVATDTDKLHLTDGSLFAVKGTIGAQATFSRLFKNKSDSLHAKAYTLKRLPWTAQRAKDLMIDGDAVRVEMFLDLAGGLFNNSDITKWKMDANFNQSRGVRFLVDVYMMKNNKARVRLIGQRNDGVLNAGFKLSPLNLIKAKNGLWGKALLNLVGCNLVNISESSSNTDDPPIDTQMEDYVFSLNTPEGAEAYDAVMASVYHFKYKEMLNPWLIIQGRKVASEKIEEAFRNSVEKALKTFKEDRTVSVESRRVDRIFKGKTLSALNGTNSESSCLHIWDLQLHDNSSRTLIKSYDRNDVVSYEVFENLQVDTKQAALFSTWETNVRNNISAFIIANVDEKNNYHPDEMTDVVFGMERRDKDFTYSEYLSLKKFLKAILPEKTFSKVDWSDFEKDGPTKKTNINSKYEIVFHRDALLAVPELGYSEFYARAYQYLKNFPDRDYLVMTPEPSGPDWPRSNDPMDKFSIDLQTIAYQMNILFTKDNEKWAKTNAFARLRENNVFRHIGAGLLISLLPPEKVDSLVAFRLDINGANDLAISYKNSTKGLSQNYNDVSFIINLITDRSFDLRLQVDEHGNVTPMRQNQLLEPEKAEKAVEL